MTTHTPSNDNSKNPYVNSMTNVTDDWIEEVIAQACTEAIAAINPEGSYPLDTAIINTAAAEIRRRIVEARIDELRRMFGLRIAKNGDVYEIPTDDLVDRITELKKKLPM